MYLHKFNGLKMKFIACSKGIFIGRNIRVLAEKDWNAIMFHRSQN